VQPQSIGSLLPARFAFPADTARVPPHLNLVQQAPPLRRVPSLRQTRFHRCAKGRLQRGGLQFPRRIHEQVPAVGGAVQLGTVASGAVGGFIEELAGLRVGQRRAVDRS